MLRLTYLPQEIIRGQRPLIEAQSQFVINQNLSDDSLETFSAGFCICIQHLFYTSLKRWNGYCQMTRGG